MFNQIISFIDAEHLINTEKDDNSMRFYFDKEYDLEKLLIVIKKLQYNVVFFNHYFIDGNFNNGLILIIPFLDSDNMAKLIYF